VSTGPMPVLAGDIPAGRLITPFANIRVPRIGYVALVPFDADKTTSLKAFVEWLSSQGTILQTQRIS
jgi:LysR family transcriptional regulator, glycine cleavage system transcriptional activator